MKLENLSKIVSGGTPSTKRKDFWENGNIPWINSGKLNEGYVNEGSKLITQKGLEGSSTKLMPPDTVLIALTGATVGTTALLNIEACANQSVVGILPSEKHNSKYLLYYLKSIYNNILNDANGAAQPGINQKYVRNILFPNKPLEEQNKITEILDKAFEKIDKAIANIERNIENAEELNKSFVNNILTPTKKWLTSNFELLFKLKSGEALSSKKMNPGSIPVYGGNGITGFHNSSNLSPPQVIVGRVGANCGNVRLVEKNIWLTDNAFSVLGELQKFNLNYLTHALNFLNLRSFARQSAQPVISNSSLKKINFAFPGDIEEQKLIANKIDCIKSESQKLVSGYQNKLIELKNLKKSILEKAFKGELTSAA